MQYVCALLILLLSTTLNAGQGYNYPNHKMGFWITPQLPDNANWALKSGERHTFNGDICVVKWKHFDKKEKCEKIKESQIEIKAYFPDALTEVTDQLEITRSHDQKSWNYSFETPELVAGANNAFTLVIGSTRGEVSKLLKVKAKIDKRIQVLRKLNFKHKHKGRFKHDYEAYVQELITKLERIKTSIDDAIDAEPEVLARLVMPLQVDNDFAAPLHYSSNFSGHKLSLTVPLGSPIDGEFTEVIASITNLSHLNFKFPTLEHPSHDNDAEVEEDNKHLYQAKLSFNEHEIFALDSVNLAFGQTHTERYDIGPLSAFSPNQFIFELDKSLKRKDGQDRKLHKWAALKLDMPVSVDPVAPVISNVLPLPSYRYAQHMAPFSAIISDEFGRLVPQTFSLTGVGELIDGQTQNLDFTERLVLTNLDLTRSFAVNAELNPLAEGEWLFAFSGEDHAGNIAEITHVTRIDRTKPLIALGNPDNTLTNIPSYTLPVIIEDHSPIEVRVFHNGNQILLTEENIFNLNVTLTEGINTFEIQVVDAAGNVADPARLNDVELDTIPPVLSNFFPEDGSIVSIIDFNILAKSNEPLLKVLINNEDINIQNGATQINQYFDAKREEPLTLTIIATDLATNSATYTINTEVVLKVIRADLISLMQHPTDPSLLIIEGQKWAARPGVEVSTGFFGLYSTVADEKGRFSLTIPVRGDVTLRGYDSELDRADYAYLNYAIDTTFSGLVQSLDERPLPGVTVRILNSGQSAVTDSSGIFIIDKPATGNQIVSFDATGLSEINEEENVTKVFHKTNVAFNLGNNQRNVLSKPITLIPLVLDGNQTQVEDGLSTTVTSINVEGFALEVSADTALFPSGQNSGEISVTRLNAEFLNVEPPKFVRPKSVYALEPSGLKFTEPAKLILPNENELPPKTQLVIYSKNSDTGIWEIDGLAAVNDSGDSVETLPNSGITHFSEVFAAPIAPKLKPYKHDAVTGAVANTKGSSLAIEMPSLKMFDQDFAPTLRYNSAWANPLMIVSNLISVDKQERILARQPNGTARIEGTSFDVEFEGKTWVEPEKVTAWASVADTTTEKYEFKGVPNNSVISYALDLKDQQSGFHPYLSEYEIQLKQMTIGTVHLRAKSGIAGLFGESVSQPYENSYVIEELFPQSHAGNLIIQNKRDSNFGAGWKLGLTKQILDPQSSVLAVENEDGTVKTYHADNRIQNIYTETNDTISGGNLIPSSDGVISLATQDGRIKDISLADSSIARETILHKYNGSIGYGFVNYEGTYSCGSFGKKCARYRCHQRVVHYTQTHIVSSLFKKPDGSYLAADSKGAMFTFDDDFTEVVAGRVSNMSSGSSGYKNSICGQNGMSCYNDVYLGKYDSAVCYGYPGSSGQHVVAGFSDGDRSSAMFNHITDFSESLNNSLLIADYGNNAVRSLDLSTNSVRTFAGNRQTLDNGDGGLATQASLYHPLGVTSDAQGNVYISTERGYIRKVDINGYITTIAGKRLEDGGKIKLSGFAKNMALSRPYGMVVDNSKNTLYVADSGNNRVLAIELAGLHSYVVAGDGECRPTMRDNVPATAASLCNPERVGLDSEGNLLVFDKGHNSIRKVILNNSSNKLAYFSLDKDGTVLEKGVDGTFTYKTRSGDKAFFDNKGLQVRTLSRTGIEFNYGYLNDLLTLVSFEDKNIYQIQYDGNQLSSIIDLAGRETFFDIVDGRLTNVVFPDGSQESFTYDQEAKVQSYANKLGKTSSFQYNDYSELLSITNPLGHVTTYINGDAQTIGGSEANPTELKDFNDPTLSDFVIDPKNVSTELKKDFSGYVSSIIDVSGNETKIERDAEARPIKITRPDGSASEFIYSENTGDLIRKIEPDVVVDFFYNDYGQLLKEENSLGQWIQNTFDETSGVLLSSINHVGQSTSATYNQLGLVATKTNSVGATTAMARDELYNTASITDPLGLITSFVRDFAGNILQITDANSRTIERSYDLFNRLLNVKDARGNTTNYQYLVTGELANIVDPHGNQTSFLYNDIGQLIEKVDPLGFSTLLSYDEIGNLTQEIDPNGNIKNFEYNSRNKLVKKILPDNLYEFSYNSLGDITNLSDKNSLIEFEYERISGSYRVAEEVWTGRGELSDFAAQSLAHTYNSIGNISNTSTIVGNYSYAYDSANRLSAVLNPFNEEFQFDYDFANRLTTISRPGSITKQFFDSTNFLTEIRHENLNGDILGRFEYARDNVGNRTAMRTPAGENQFNYDPDQQITSSVGPDVGLENFEYDLLGNRTTDQGGAYVYDQKRQRLVSDYRYLYYHDNNGNLVSKTSKDLSKTINYHYSSENQLIKIEWFENNVLLKEARYSFDALGRRMQKVVIDHENASEKTRRFIYNGQEVIAQLNQENDVLAVYTPSGLRTDDTLSVKVTSAGVAEGVATQETSLSYLKDGLGSNMHLVDANGAKKQSYRYSAFGTIREVLDESGTATATPLLSPYLTYTNREFDEESGLYFYRARNYDSSIGRFMQYDSDSGVMNIPSTFNTKYSYVMNNPLNFTDSQGLSIFKDFTNYAFDSAANILNESSSYISKVTGVDKRIIDSTFLVAGGSALIVFGGPVGTAAGIGLLYGGFSSIETPNPYKRGVRFAAVGAAAATVGLGAAHLGTLLGGGVIGTSVGVGLGGYLGYNLGGSVGEYLGLDRRESSLFGLTIGIGAGLGGSNPPKPSSSGKFNWAGGRLIPQ